LTNLYILIAEGAFCIRESLFIILIGGFAMNVRADMLREGWVIEKPIYSLSDVPIINSGKILTNEDIEIINAFLICDVEVQINKNVSNSASKEEKTAISSIEFVDIYLETIKKYKNHFNSWESGVTVNILEIRKILLPIIEYSYQDSTKKLFIPSITFKDDKEKIVHHSLLCTMLATMLATRLKYSKGDVIQIGISAALCNAGYAKYHFQSLVQLKNNTEYRSYPMHSYRMVEKIQFLRDQMKVAILQHQERLDGSGFPLKIKAKYINEFASILGVGTYYFDNVLDPNLTQNDFQFIEHLNKELFGKFHPRVIDVLKNLIIQYQLGDRVLLSNGVLGQIVYQSPVEITRPIIKVENSETVIDLAKDRTLYIQELL
jgi:HD-GYP domain-containing protein (c-di-GMP phosphodiesterase class II)